MELYGRVPHILKHGIDFSGNKVTGLLDPTQSDDAVTLAYLNYALSNINLDAYQLRTEKNVAGGYAGLDSSGLVPLARIPTMDLAHIPPLDLAHIPVMDDAHIPDAITRDTELTTTLVPYRLKTDGAFAGTPITMGGSPISGLPNPPATGDGAASKAYVDAQISGIPVTAYTASNGIQMVGHDVQMAPTIPGLRTWQGNQTINAIQMVDDPWAEGGFWTQNLPTTHASIAAFIGAISYDDLRSYNAQPTIGTQLKMVLGVAGGVNVPPGATFGTEQISPAEHGAGMGGFALSAGDRNGVGFYAHGMMAPGGTLRTDVEAGLPPGTGGARVQYGCWGGNFVFEDANIATWSPVFSLELNMNVDNSNNVVRCCGLGGNGMAQSTVYSAGLYFDFLSVGGKYKTFWVSEVGGQDNHVTGGPISSGAGQNNFLDTGGKWTYVIDTEPGASIHGLRMHASQWAYWGCDSMSIEFVGRDPTGVAKTSSILNNLYGQLVLAPSAQSGGQIPAVIPAAAGAAYIGTPGLYWAALYAGGSVFPSSRSRKNNITPLDPHIALQAVIDTPIYEFQYNDLHAEHGFVGYMAEDTNPLLLHEDGHVNPQTTASVALAAIQALDEKVLQLEARLDALHV